MTDEDQGLEYRHTVPLF